MRDITDNLAELRRPAPWSVEPSVLLETGIADAVIQRSTAAGPLQVAFNQHGVSASALTGDPAAFVARFEHRFGRSAFLIEDLPSAFGTRLTRALESGRVGRLPLDLRSVTPFQRTVLEVVAHIPPGEVRPYGWVAREAGNPGASRAVGSTMARNPIPVLVPCHRVVRSDGHLGNYLFGLEAKTALLEAEGLDTNAVEGNASAGHLVLGSDTTKIFCHPTCSHAQRIAETHRSWFRTVEAAQTAGYRACLVCRPAA